jgi:hypothetical protein
MKKANAAKVKEVRAQAQGLVRTCVVVLHGKNASTMPDVRITGHAIRILEAAKAITPNDGDWSRGYSAA